MTRRSRLSTSGREVANRAELDSIFGGSKVDHGLDVFKDSEFAQLDLSIRGGKAYIRCTATAKDRLAKPEEVVRQLMLIRLAHTLNYPLDAIAIEVPVKMGAAYAPKAADIVIYTDGTKLTPHMILEVKKPRRKDGMDQLHSYMNATGVHFGAWVNGHREVPQLRVEPNFFEELPRLPAFGEDVDDVKVPLTKAHLVPLEDLKEEVQYLEDTVLANAGVSTFDEVFKLIFAKLFDEADKGEHEVVDFRTTTAPPAKQYQRINGLFRKAATEWPDIFSSSDNIDLNPEALVVVASAFQKRRFFDADLDVVDAAFEYLINPEQKGDKGQYFTPRAVVKMCVKMLNPKRSERVVDPACGPGGFLIHCLHWVTEHDLRPRYKANLEKRRFDYANSRLYGLDFDVRLARVAKAMMLIAGDGKSHIYRVNSLDSRDWAGRPDDLTTSVTPGFADVLLTNPPFAGKIVAPEVLGAYDLAYKGEPATRKRVNRQTRDVLFIEKSVTLLKPGGRMAIVLPQGNLNNLNSTFARQWLKSRGRILAVIGLHPNTFKPFTNTKTSVVFFQKWKKTNDAQQDYPIFMGINREPVKDSSGRYVYATGRDGRPLVDASGRRIVKHDLDGLAEAFIEFARREGLDFWA